MSVLRAARVHRAPVALAAVGLATALIAGGCDWAQFRSNPAHTGAVAETAIGPGNVAQLEQAWSVDLGAGSPVSAPVAVGGNVVAEVNATAVAVAQSDGSARWSVSLPGRDGVFDKAIHTAPSTDADGIVYLGERVGVSLPSGGGAGEIDRIDGATGTSPPPLVVDVVRPVGVPTPVTVTGGDLWFNSDTEPGSGVVSRGLTGARAAGRVVFDPQTSSGGVGTPAVAANVVYTGNGTGLAAYDGTGTQANCTTATFPPAITCRALWTAATGEIAHGPAVDGGTVYVVAPDGTLSAVPVDPSLGSTHPIAWQGAAVTTDPAVEGPWVVGGSADGLRAFAAAGCGAATCAPAWIGNPGAAASTAPVIADGLVFVGTADGHVAAFARDGCGAPAGGTCAPLWAAATPGTPTAVIMANGQVIVATATGHLAAFAQRS